MTVGPEERGLLVMKYSHREVFIAQRDAIGKHFHAKGVDAPRMVSTSLVNPADEGTARLGRSRHARFDRAEEPGTTIGAAG